MAWRGSKIRLSLNSIFSLLKVRYKGHLSLKPSLQGDYFPFRLCRSDLTNAIFSEYGVAVRGKYLLGNVDFLFHRETIVISIEETFDSVSKLAEMIYDEFHTLKSW
ncbi:hypothetical protein ACFE04_019445 [Oxalis oulophora]